MKGIWVKNLIDVSLQIQILSVMFLTYIIFKENNENFVLVENIIISYVSRSSK